MKPTLYIMCGLGFSGKSTLAKTIADHKGARLISTDAMFEELGLESDNYKQWLSLLETAKKRILNSLKNGVSVIYDHPNVKISERNKLQELARSAGAHSVIVYLKTPLATVQERQVKNRETKERHDPKQEHLDAVIRDFEAPTEAEGTIRIFTPTSNISSFLQDLES